MCSGAGGLLRARCTGGGDRRGRGLQVRRARVRGGRKEAEASAQGPEAPACRANRANGNGTKKEGAAGMASGGGESGVRRPPCCSGGALAGGGEGGGKKPRQALQARRLRHAERTVLPAVALRRKGVRPGRSRVVGAAGCGVGGVGVSVGGAGGGGLEFGGVTTGVGRGGGVPFRAALRGPRPVWCGRGGLDRQRSTAGPPVRGRGGCQDCGRRVVWWCGGVSYYLAVHYEEVARKSKPGEGNRGAGGGLSPAGMAGFPWDPVGAEPPQVGGVRNHGLVFRHRSS